MQILPEPSMPGKYRASAKVLGIGTRTEAVTRQSIAESKAAAMKEQADVLDATGAPQLLQTVIKLQAEEVFRALTIADEAAQILHTTPLDELPRERRADLERGAAYLMRHAEPGWKAAAMDHARPVVAALLCEELRLSPAHAEALAVKLTAFAVTAYGSVLDGTTAIAPGPYLRIQAAKTERER